MRLNICFSFRDSPDLDKNYRTYFHSIIKSSFEKAGFYNNVFGNKRFRPYTFSVYLGKDAFPAKKIELKGRNVYLLFSTGDPEVFVKFYNGILDIKADNSTPYRILDIRLLPQKKIVSGKVLFRTVGITVFSDRNASEKEFKKRYPVPTDDLKNFNRVMNERTIQRYNYLTGGSFKLSEKLAFSLLSPAELALVKKVKKDVVGIMEEVVPHYNGYIRGFRGYFWLEGPQELLQFVYDYGFGVRTGQGFGMLDKVVEVK